MSDLDRQSAGIHFDDENEDDDEDDSDDGPCELVLRFTSNGTAILEEEGESVWFSDDDDDFRELAGNEFLEAEEDTSLVLNYLVEDGLVSEEEKGCVTIEQEDLDEDDTDSLHN